MSPRRTLLLGALLATAPMAMVFAQTEAQSGYERQTPPPSSASPSTTNPSSTSPSSSSSSSDQQSSSQSTRTASKEQMKECIAKQKADNSGMSTADARKACKAQMKGPG
jgi:cytoskeletal protein RodZ